VPWWIRVDDRTSTESLAWRRAPYDESIVLEERERGTEPKLDPGGFSGIQPLAVEERDAGGQLGGSRKEINLVILLQRHRRIRYQSQARVEALARRHQPGRGKHITPLDLFRGNAGEIDRRAPPR